jgi:hypothetical protein
MVANLLFAAGGLFLLWQMASGGRVLNAIDQLDLALAGVAASPFRTNPSTPPLSGLLSRFQSRPQRAQARNVFPRILDEVRGARVPQHLLPGAGRLCHAHAGLHLLRAAQATSCATTLRWSTVGEYLVNLTPSMLYQITPLAVLIAVLVTFGVLNRNSEIIAMKACGISLYRLVIPIVSIAAILALSLFLFDQFYLPQANRKQEALRNIIKGRPPQTVLHPEQNWIFGQPRPGEPGRIFYYQFFDPDRNEFANLSSSSSIPPPLRSRGASLPPAPYGIPKPLPGAS